MEDLAKEGVPAALRAHKAFPGNKPSLSLLLHRLDAFTCGQLLAIYEHRTAVQGFIWGNNSFDQWGVELGKQLALEVAGDLTDADAPLRHDSSTNQAIELYRTARRRRT